VSAGCGYGDGTEEGERCGVWWDGEEESLGVGHVEVHVVVSLSDEARSRVGGSRMAQPKVE
jgi:hypothetical protein